MLQVSIIANGFQKDYMVNLIRGLSKTPCFIEIIGSSLYDFNKKVISGNVTEVMDARIPDTSFVKRLFNNLRYYCRLSFHFIRKRPDIIHIQWLNLVLTDGIIFPLFFRALGIKTVYTVHDVLPHDKGHFINRLLFSWVYSMQNHLLVHTRFIKQRLINEFGIKPDKITIIKHGVYDIRDYPSIDETKARDRLMLGHHDFVMLLFGNITKYKGLHILLEAYTSLASDDRSMVLVIAGPVAKDYASEFDMLMNKYKSDRIFLFNSHISEERMHVLFKAADVTVLPYTEASQSGVLFMSYAFGKPVIAPRLGGFPDDIVESRTGFLFQAGNPESLAETISKFRVEWTENLRNGCGEIKTYAHEHYSWDKTGETLFKMYSGLKKKSEQNNPYLS